MEAARLPWPALGMLLIRDGLVTSEELEDVLARQGDEREQRISSQRLGETLVADGTVTSAQIARLVAEQHELPFVDLDEPDSMVPVRVHLPEDVARAHCALPIRGFPDGSVLVVVGDPTRPGCFDDVRSALGVPVRFAMAAPDAIAVAIEASAGSTTFVDDNTGKEEDDRPPVVEIVADDLVARAPEDRTPQLRAGVGPWPLLGSLLLRDGFVGADDLYAALAQQRLSSTKRLGEILVARGSLTDEQVSRALAEQHELPFVELAESEIDPAVASLLPVDLARAHLALPISHVGEGALLVVVADPASAVHADELRAALGVPLQFAVAMSEDIDAAIDSLATPDYEPLEEPIEVLEAESEPSTADIAPPPTPGPAADQEPSARLETVSDALERALAAGATAVHFTRGPDGLLVRARIDGNVTEFELLSGTDADAAEATLAELTAATRVTVVAGEQTFELRPTTLTTTIGQRTTFRVVMEGAPATALDDVFPQDISGPLREALARPNGLIVFCGLTPASRATALRTTMLELASQERIVLTVENPAEILLAGVEQTEVDALAGLTYPAVLQAVLRSDPDVAVVDELLDPETTRLAVRGARDRLVLTTLDAPASASAIRRLHELGVTSSALADTLTVIGQAQVRRLCEACRESYYASDDDLVELGLSSDERGRRLLGRSRGCGACDATGYRDSIDLFETLPVSDEIRLLVAHGASVGEIERAAITAGMPTLRESAVRLCLDGVTSSDEVRNVFRPQS